MSPNIYAVRNLSSQSGVVLIVALIVLLVMTGIGVTLMTGSTLQERMAGNSRQLAVARHNAESALREAELILDNLGISNADDIATVENQFVASLGAGSDRAFKIEVTSLRDPLTIDLTVPANWSDTNSILASTPGTSAQAPRFVVEYLGRTLTTTTDNVMVGIDRGETGDDQLPHTFRITAIGYGRSENITGILQSIYTTAQ